MAKTNANTKEKSPPMLPSPYPGKAPSPQPEDTDTGIGTDGDIQDGLQQQWMMHMLQKMLGSGLVPPEMNSMEGGMGAGMEQNSPGALADPNAVGALFDPTPMARQQRKY